MTTQAIGRTKIGIVDKAAVLLKFLSRKTQEFDEIASWSRRSVEVAEKSHGFPMDAPLDSVK